MTTNLPREVERQEQLRRQIFEARLAEEYRFFSQETATLVAESLPVQTAAAEKVWQWLHVRPRRRSASQR